MNILRKIELLFSIECIGILCFSTIISDGAPSNSFFQKKYIIYHKKFVSNIFTYFDLFQFLYVQIFFPYSAFSLLFHPLFLIILF